MLRQTIPTNNGKVTSVISNRYQYGEGESQPEKRLTKIRKSVHMTRIVSK